MARDMMHENDFEDVQLPANMGKSREVEVGFNNDKDAQHKGATQLAYSLHGSRCQQCGNAQGESELCNVGRALYQAMRSAGVVE